MAVAAATAVISPVALLAAPAAFATDGQQDGQTSETTPAPTASESETTAPEESAEPTTDPEETEPAPAESESAPEETPGTEEPGTEPTEGTEEPSEDPEPSPSQSEGEDEEDPDDGYEICLDEDGNELADLGVSVSGLPGQVRAGSTHEFTLSAANSGKNTLESVEWGAMLANENDDLWLEDGGLISKIDLAFYDPEANQWVPSGIGVAFGETTLKAGQTVDIKLRMTVAKDAPLGAGYAFGFTGYVNEEENCTTEAYAFYDFTVIGASATPKPGDAKENEGKKPQGGLKPIEEKKTLEPTGQLAETGAGSMLPVIGLVGGVTVLAGTGVVFAVRRRGGVGTAA
ncbi:Integral membrane protein [Streptomyces sp. GBA 94-10 4N24]|nr:Integral membrane protein [Streptomyces sp. GBA 94-10 4N24]UZN60901.1 Integral membrane protein [Streptomyces sp. GBA 94-10 4N24]